MRAFAADAGGATAIEYAMIGGFISIMIVAGATLIGTTVAGFFTSVLAGLK